MSNRIETDNKNQTNQFLEENTKSNIQNDLQIYSNYKLSDENNNISNNEENYQNTNNKIIDSSSDNSSNIQNDEVNYQNTNNKIIDSSSNNSKIENNEKNPKINNLSSSCFSKNKKCLLIIGLISLITIIVIVVSLIIILKNIKVYHDDIINFPDFNKYTFKLNVKDIKSISIEQNDIENIISNGNISSVNRLRKTNYEYFLLSEEESDEENKNFYEKKYTVAILISSQCFHLMVKIVPPNK